MTTRIAAPETPRAGEQLRNSILVIVIAVVALGAGWAIKSSVQSRSTAFTALNGALTVSYPSSWVRAESSDAETRLEVADAKAIGGQNPTFRIQSRSIPAGQSLLDAAMSQSLRRARSLQSYRELSTVEEVFAGRPALRVTYAYVAEPPSGAGRATLPVVVQATDVLLLHEGQLLALSTAGEAASAEKDQPALERILRSVRIQ